MNVVICCIVYLRVDQATGTIPQLNHPLDALLRRLIEYGTGHHRIFAVVNLTVHERIREIAHIGISRNRPSFIYIRFGYFYPFIFPVDVPHRRMELLREVSRRLEGAGYRLGNLDATIIAQRPKLAPHIEQMRRNIAGALHTGLGNISVKATTEERLGFTGSGEGIAAHAVCLIE